jgi:enoyl-CoA hydratase/carnithine racemase
LGSRQASNLGFAPRTFLVRRLDVGSGEARKEAEALAATLAKRPAQAMRSAKRLINACFDAQETSLVSQSLMESDHIFCSDDAKEGVSAFLEKRAPNFRYAMTYHRSSLLHSPGSRSRSSVPM